MNAGAAVYPMTAGERMSVPPRKIAIAGCRSPLYAGVSRKHEGARPAWRTLSGTSAAASAPNLSRAGNLEDTENRLKAAGCL
jgi:hypothetical protein